MYASITTPATELPNGAEGVELLQATVPCPIWWCTGCAWEADEVGGAISRLHTWRDDSGIEVSAFDYPPSDPRNYDQEATEPSIFVPSGDHLLSTSLALWEALGRILGTVRGQHTSASSMTTASWPCQGWAVVTQVDGGHAVSERRASNGPRVSLIQNDEIERVDGQWTVTRTEPFFIGEFDGLVVVDDCDVLTVEQARDIAKGPAGNPVITSLAELLAAYDAAS